MSLCSLVLLLAYMKGNANLCRAIVRAGARLGVNNNQGINIFNYQVATKQLLFRLLGMTSKYNSCWLSIKMHCLVSPNQITFIYLLLSLCLLKICCLKSPHGAMAPTVTNALPSLESRQESITGMYLKCSYLFVVFASL